MTKNTELATSQTGITDAQLISYLDTLGLTSKLSEAEKTTYLSIAKAFGLNPFKREIHVSKYGEQMSVITGYEVYIKRAERTGQLDGWTATTTGSADKGDLKATVTIYRKDRNHPFIWEALYDECVQKTREGKPTKFWEKAAFMTKKVAISQAFRLCFSDELAGMPYTSDEIPSTEDISHVEVQQPKKLEPSKEEQKPILAAGTKNFTNAVKAMQGGKKLEELREVAYISPEVEKLLLEAMEEPA